MDIDALFKVPKLPSSRGIKRPLPSVPSPEDLKRFKAASDLETQSASSRVTIEDDIDSHTQQEQFAPGNDADYYTEEDEEGRFYGGGLTDEQKEILNLFESAQTTSAVDEDSGPLTLPGIRKALLHFERAVDRNLDQRSKFPNDPSKFIDSEADLDLALKGLLPLAQVPNLAFPEFSKMGVLEKFVQLLTHDNMDIVIDVVEVVREYTDEDVTEGPVDSEEIEPEAREKPLKSLVDAFMRLSVLELLAQNLSRFNEEEESDRQGLFHVLAVFENILGLAPQVTSELVTSTPLLPWLLKRMSAEIHDENRSYSAELMSILLQSDSKARHTLNQRNGIETLLQVASRFRRFDPRDADELEFMDNVFDSICCALEERDNQESFVNCEGIDLMTLMLKEPKECRTRALKVLDYTLSRTFLSDQNRVFVEAAGLKPLFNVFMGLTKSTPKATMGTVSDDTVHCLGIMGSLLSSLESEAVERLRLLAKFVEKQYAAVDRLLEIRSLAVHRLQQVDVELNTEEPVENSIEVYVRRLDGGLFTLQNVDYILAWIAMEDDGIQKHIKALLERRSNSLNNICRVLEEQVKNMSETDNSEGVSRRDIIHHLIAYFKTEGETVAQLPEEVD